MSTDSGMSRGLCVDSDAAITSMIIVASPFDWLFAKGAVASCQFFAPKSPLQLIVDGDVDTTAAERTYGVKILRANDIESRELRRLGFGWGTTKMLAFWYSPTEQFVYLDSDAVLWGDLRGKVEFNGADYIASIRKCEELDRETVENWFFDVSFVENKFPDWDWRRSSSSFFCPGVFAARKGAFCLEDYLSILELNEQNPGKFKFGDMGFHNLMVFWGEQTGSLKVNRVDFQVIFTEHPQDELKKRFAFDDRGFPVVNPGDEQVLHMPDKKPLVDNPECYSRPMTFFRLKYLEDTEGITGDAAMERLRAEDAEYEVLRKRFLKRQKWGKVKKLLQGHPGSWRQLLAKVRLK